MHYSRAPEPQLTSGFTKLAELLFSKSVRRAKGIILLCFMLDFILAA